MTTTDRIALSELGQYLARAAGQRRARAFVEYRRFSTCPVDGVSPVAEDSVGADGECAA